MAGIKALRKIQIGQEGTAGTATDATYIWRGMGTMQDARVVEFVEEDVGIIGGTTRSYIPMYDATIEFESTPATYEEIGYILACGVENTTTGTQDGTGSGYSYQYDAPTTSKNSIQTLTIEGGDDQQAEEMEYSYVESFTLSGAQGESWMMQASWRGRQVTNSSFTTGISLASVEEILFGNTKLYIDNSGGSFGGTQKSNTLLAATLNYNTGWVPLMPTGDGNLYFPSNKMTEDEITLDITFEHDGTATGEKTNWRNETIRLIRLQAEGSSLTTTGTSYSKKTLTIDLAGKWESFDAIGDQDGNDIIDATFRCRYSDSDSAKAQIIVVNENSSLT